MENKLSTLRAGRCFRGLCGTWHRTASSLTPAGWNHCLSPLCWQMAWSRDTGCLPHSPAWLPHTPYIRKKKRFKSSSHWMTQNLYLKHCRLNLNSIPIQKAVLTCNAGPTLSSSSGLTAAQRSGLLLCRHASPPWNAACGFPPVCTAWPANGARPQTQACMNRIRSAPFISLPMSKGRHILTEWHTFWMRTFRSYSPEL